MSITYKISGITCSGCQAKVQHLFSAIEGVKDVKVDLETGNTQIEFSDAPIALSAFEEALKPYPKYQIVGEANASSSWFNGLLQKIGLCK
jgi:copper chaperone CopZ